MEKEPQHKPPRKRPLVVAFVLVMVGLFVLDGAIGLLAGSHANAKGWMLLGLSVALIALGVLWGSKRI